VGKFGGWRFGDSEVRRFGGSKVRRFEGSVKQETKKGKYCPSLRNRLGGSTEGRNHQKEYEEGRRKEKKEEKEEKG